MSLAPHVLVAEPLAECIAGQDVGLDAARVRHLRRVLRLADGAPLSLTDGRGAWAAARLMADGAQLSNDAISLPPIGPRLVLAQALSKGRRAEDAVRTACELGVDRVVPVVADRTQGRPDARAAAGVVERWCAIATAALEQSRGVRLAEVHGPVATRTLAAEVCPADSVRLVAVPGAPPLPDVLADIVVEPLPVEVVIAIGPEGGWSPAEVDTLLASGWLHVGLGPTVLRTEHAGPVAVAVIAAVAGRWAGAPTARDDAIGSEANNDRLLVRPFRSTDAL